MTTEGGRFCRGPGRFDVLVFGNTVNSLLCYRSKES